MKWRKTNFKQAAPKFEVHKSGTEIAVNVVVDDEELYLILGNMSHHSLRHCEASVDALRERVFKGREVKIWRVVDVQVPEHLRGEGYGKKLYEKAFKAAKPAIIVTGGCTGMSTTAAAFRVWKSMSRKYEYEGSTPNDSAIAVR